MGSITCCFFFQDEDQTKTSNVKELVKTVNDRYRGFAEMEEEKERLGKHFVSVCR